MAEGENHLMREELLVEGSVQGVGYRYTVSRIASDITGITGWVKNLPDGRVLVLCEGAPAGLEEFRERIRIVGKRINVTNIEIASRTETKERFFFGFTVARD